MLSKPGTISACLVVYNEEAVIERCLLSIRGLVDEIIIVHDGECSDQTLVIAKRYTDKVFVRDHAGMMEAHLVFAFEQATSEWLFRIDADEFVDKEDFVKIKEAVSEKEVSALILKWEMWDGQRVIEFPGLQKMCLVRRDHFHYCGIPHENGFVDGGVKKIDVYLHHRPAYNNIVWSSFMRKARKWVPVHVTYFFPEETKFDCFNTDSTSWIETTKYVRKHLWYYQILEPFKMALGQLKNGLWKNHYGWQVVFERYVYYVMLYRGVYKKQKLIAK